MNYDAVLVVSFGGPESPEDVIPFLENVLRGRNVPRERMLAVAEHYYHFGGKSPINQQTRELIAALENELAQHGPKLPVYWGNRNWHPRLAETLQRMRQDGIRRASAQGSGQFAMALAGPLANISTALVLAAAFLGASGEFKLMSYPWITAAYLLRSMVWMQVGLGLLHLLPAYPLDGGRLLRGSFARKHGFALAGRISTGLGQALALAAMAGGMYLHDYWLGIAGFFIMIGAQIEDQGVFFQSVVDTVHMREVMLTDFATLSPSDQVPHGKSGQ